MTESIGSTRSAPAPAETPTEVGRCRRVLADGRSGIQPLSRSAGLVVDTDVLTGPEWTIALWICPVEDLDTATTVEWSRDGDPGAQCYSMVSDAGLDSGRGDGVFGWWWLSELRPAMQVKVVRGYPRAAEHPPAAAQVEHCPLHAGTWYRMVVTFSAADHRLCLWVNRHLAGISDFDFDADQPGTRLYIGNPAMAFAELSLERHAWSAGEVTADFTSTASAKSQAAAAEMRSWYEPVAPQTARWTPGPDWRLSLEAGFTDPQDLAGWVLHGCQQPPHEMVAMETSPAGLLLQTPDVVAEESRMYLWSPRVFEGDVAVEFAFRVEQDSGFGMLVVHASGMQGEDFLTDHPEHNTGAMSVIARSHVRDYYWGFFRRTPTTPKHVASHTLVKNPWMRNIALSASDPLAVEVWHRLLFVQQGGRLRGAINGQWVVAGTDDPWQNHGPVLNHGRIALRLMYQTRMRIRDLKVWSRPGPVVAMEDATT